MLQYLVALQDKYGVLAFSWARRKLVTGTY